MSPVHVSLAEDFRRFFKVSLATTFEQKQAVYGLRYRVYCEELEYEPATSFPDKLECDEFDERSLHCLVIHRRSGLAAGCVRLVRTRDDQSHAPLPIEKHCAHSLDPATVGFMKHNRGTICEISRLAVDGRFRRRFGEDRSQLGELDALDMCHQELRTFSLVATASFMAATALTELTGCHHIFAMMEVFLPKVLARSGLHFERAGKEIDYHGWRAPYFITTQSAIEHMRPELKEFYLSIYENLAGSYADLRHAC